MRLLLETVDAHAQGDPARVIFGGGIGRLAAPGRTMFDQMKHFESEADWLRRLVLREPRGFSHMCANLIMPPTDPRCEAGFIILEQQDYYAAMSGTNTIIVATVLLETGRIAMVEPVTEFWLEPPAGPVRIRAHCRAGRVERVDIENVPGFVATRGARLDIPGAGALAVDVAFGGMAYVLVDAAPLGLALTPDEALRIQDLAATICDLAQERIGFRHPADPALTAIEGVIFYCLPEGPDGRIRQVPVNSGSQVGRTPAGTACSAMMALRHAQGLWPEGESAQIEGMLDNPFHCRILATTRVGDREAILPEIGGRAFITGYGTMVLEDDDPYPEGFMVADLWPAARKGSAAARAASRKR